MPEFHTDYQQNIYTAVSSELLHSFIQLVTNCHQSLINLKRKEYRPNGGHDYAGKDVATQKQIHSDVTQITDVLRMQIIAFVALFLGNVLEKEKGE